VSPQTLKAPRRQKSKKSRILLALLVLIGPPAFAPALAVEVSPQENPGIPCALISKMAGEVEIFDASRTHLLDATVKAGIPCGGWLSTKQAWVELTHRDGYRVHVGSHAFVQFPESNVDGTSSGDHVVLYKGQVFGSAGGGAGELRVATANARARVTRGSVLLTFTQETEESQMTTLDNTATFENIFENTRKVTAKAGEATSLDLSLQRVVPTPPKAVAVASLKPKLLDLHIENGEQARAVEASIRRADRTLAAKLYDVEKNEAIAKPGRKPAGSYVRHASDKEDAELKSLWTKKMVAGDEEGERILFPERFYGRPQKVKVQVIDPHPHLTRSDDSEKKRLIEELSRIREE
jgi:hypothetical protein